MGAPDEASRLRTLLQVTRERHERAMSVLEAQADNLHRENAQLKAKCVSLERCIASLRHNRDATPLRLRTRGGRQRCQPAECMASEAEVDKVKKETRGMLGRIRQVWVQELQLKCREAADEGAERARKEMRAILRRLDLSAFLPPRCRCNGGQAAEREDNMTHSRAADVSNHLELEDDGHEEMKPGGIRRRVNSEASTELEDGLSARLNLGAQKLQRLCRRSQRRVSFYRWVRHTQDKHLQDMMRLALSHARKLVAANRALLLIDRKSQRWVASAFLKWRYVTTSPRPLIRSMINAYLEDKVKVFEQSHKARELAQLMMSAGRRAKTRTLYRAFHRWKCLAQDGSFELLREEVMTAYDKLKVAKYDNWSLRRLLLRSKDHDGKPMADAEDEDGNDAMGHDVLCPTPA